MRISDWSSDVCSSDLLALPVSIRLPHGPMQTSLRWTSDWAISPDGSPAIIGSIRLAISQRAISQGSKPNTESCKSAVRVEALCCSSQGEYGTGKAGAPKKSLSYSRSDEHKSELQSLM